MGKQFIKDLHDALLFILSEVHRVCRKHDIKYTLGYGTLIGAVRHKGFIPWDDDADIVMTRKEYEKFVAVADELDPLLKISLPKESLYGEKLSKIIMQHSTIQYPDFNNKDISYIREIYLDIMVIDVITPFDRAIFMFLRTVKAFQRDKTFVVISFLGYFIIPACFFAGIFLSKDVIDMLYEKILQKILRKSILISEKKPNALGKVYWHDSWALKTVFPVCFFENVKDVDFENIKLMIPQEYDKILTQIYGDYMTPPPNMQNAAFDTWDNRQKSQVGHGFYRVQIEHEANERVRAFLKEIERE